MDLANTLQRGSDRICNLILYSDYDWVDIQIEANRLREICRAEAPEKLALFDALYLPRFDRLWRQWRDNRDESPLPPGYSPYTSKPGSIGF